MDTTHFRALTRISIFTVFLLPAFCLPAFALDYRNLPEDEVEVEVVPSGVAFSLPLYFQPNFEQPRKYTVEDMEILAQEALFRVGKKLGGVPFDRRNPQHVRELAEFFLLTPVDKLDPFSAAMDDSDIRYFSEIDVHQDSELYPSAATELAVRFYWEGMARLAAAYYRVEIVSERFGRRPEKTRGKVSDIATSGMFDKIRGMSLEEASDYNKERYDMTMLVKQLQAKGRPV